MDLSWLFFRGTDELDCSRADARVVDVRLTATAPPKLPPGRSFKTPSLLPPSAPGSPMRNISLSARGAPSEASESQPAGQSPQS